VRQTASIAPSSDWRARHIGLDETHHPQVAKLAMTAEAFCRHSIRNTNRRVKWLILGGMTGCGKTHAAKRISRRFKDCRSWAWEKQFWPAMPNAEFWRWQELADMEEDDWKRVCQEIDGVGQVRGIDLLVLDDVGAETDRFKSGVPTARLQQVMDTMEHRWLLITTNVPKDQWAERWDKRIASRMEASSYISLFNVPDYRPKMPRREAGQGRPDVFTDGQCEDSGA
jgi:DNA polymerase III delta prime subunit